MAQNMNKEYYFMKSLTDGATWADAFYDIAAALASVLAGMIVYIYVNRSLFKVVDIDVSDLDNKNPRYVYTEEEARERYGPDEGREFGDTVQICGTKLPKSRALKFVQRCGPKVAKAFMKLSYEERHAVMSGAGQFPKEFMQESLQEYYVGSSGKFCNSCKAAPSGSDTFDICSRCKYAACKLCRGSKRLGTCYCRDENFGMPYPAPHRRSFYQRGIW